MQSPSIAETIVVNGSLSAVVGVRDRGLAYGHGVFETIRLAGGELPLWAYHEKRLRRGLDILGIPWDGARVAAGLDTLRSRCPSDGIVKLTVTAGAAGRGYQVRGPLDPTVIAQWSPPSAPVPSARLRASPYRLPSNPALAGIKHLNRLDQVMAAAAHPDDSQPLLLDANGDVVETLSHNIFVYDGERWLTPSLECCGVAGVMRAVLIERVFGALGMEVCVSNFGVEVISCAQEAFICNSVSGILPVSALLPDTHFHGHRQTRLIQATLAELYPCFTV